MVTGFTITCGIERINHKILVEKPGLRDDTADLFVFGKSFFDLGFKPPNYRVGIRADSIRELFKVFRLFGALFDLIS